MAGVSPDPIYEEMKREGLVAVGAVRWYNPPQGPNYLQQLVYDHNSGAVHWAKVPTYPDDLPARDGATPLPAETK
jgi:hypothetical protein